MKTIVLLLSLFLSLLVCNGQVSKLITNLTPGDLINQMTSEELSTVTFMAISGTMDARDFKTIRDKMPKLEEVELTNATIAEYKGLQGTSTVIGEPVQDITYPANTVPVEAFLDKKSLKQVTLPQSVTIISYHAFSNCENLLSVNSLPLVSSIQAGAFLGCKSLRSVTIPASVENIEFEAFGGSGAYITVDEQNTHYSSLDGVLFSKDQKLLISCPVSKSGKYDIPESVKTIEDAAFLSCKNLTSVYIPNSVTQIGNLAFYDCSGLSSITIPYFVSRIGIKTFMYCSNLNTVYFPINLKSIDLYAFAYCNNLTSFKIPSSVTYIGDNVFDNCTRLSSIYASPEKPVVLKSDIFRWVDKSKCMLYVPKESVDLYKAAPYWKEFSSIVGVYTSIDTKSKPTVSVFPNPAKDIISVNGDSGDIFIYNIQGKLEMIQSIGNNKKVNIASLAPGIYVLEVNGERLKFVKE